MQSRPASPASTPTADLVSTNRLLTALTWGCVVAGLVMLAVLSQRVERTADEVNYLLAGRTLVARQPLEMVEQRFQGPLILLGTQITSNASEDATAPETLHRARLGMLVFPALLLTVLVLWSRAALGQHAALLIAFLAATNPTILAYGPLLSSDVAFTATSLTAAWLLWRWLRSSRVFDLLLAGAGLGAAVATKYAGLLTSAAAIPVVVLAVCMGFDPMPPRFGPGPRSLAKRASLAAVALVVAGAVAIATLHCCYLFASPSFAPSAATSLHSGALRAIAALPLGPQLLGLLPEPLVLGIDYQTSVGSQQANGTFFDRVGNHWAFYPVSLLVKTPLATLGLAALGAVAVLQAWRRRAAIAPRFFWSCALIPPLALLVYLSATRALQMGVRYVMPMVPVLLLLAGAWLRHPWAIARVGRAVTALAVASAVFVVAAGWPYYIGFFNSIAGGSEGGYKICADGNCDWMQRHGTGQQELKARHPQLTCLRIHDGPRFGLVAAYTEDLKSRDPEDPTRTYHWLTRFTPIDHEGAAWLVFDVTPAAFEARIAAGDRRAANDLAVAWLRERAFARARAALAMLPAGTEQEAQSTRRVRELIDLMEAVEKGDEAQRNTAVDRLVSAGHPDLALSLLTRPQRSDAIRVFLLTWAAGRGAEAIETLEQKGADGSRTPEEVYVLASAMHDGARDFLADPMRAQRLMELGPAPAPGSPLEKPWQELLQKVRRAALWFRQIAK